MSELKLRQQQMMQYLLHGDGDFSKSLEAPSGVDPEQRLSIYYNGYRLRLAETLAVDHDLLGSYLGDELFEKLTYSYIEAHPSTSKSLRNFADHLPDFLKSDGFFKDYPQLSEFARFERSLLSSFDAPECAILPNDYLQTLAVELWPGTCLSFHPSAQLFFSEWNSVTIWLALKAEQTPPPPDLEKSCWLVWRSPQMLTEFVSLDAVDVCIAQCVLESQSFTEICNAMAQIIAEEEVPARLVGTLTRWLAQGLIAS